MAPHGCVSKRDIGIVCAIGVARGLGGGGWTDEPPLPIFFSFVFVYVRSHTQTHTQTYIKGN